MSEAILGEIKELLEDIKGLLILTNQEQLEKRIEAEERKIQEADNYSTKIVGMIGDMAKEIVRNTEKTMALENRIEKLERRLSNGK